MPPTSAWPLMGVLTAAFAGLSGCATVPGEPPVVVECKTATDSVRTGAALVGQSYGMSMTPIPINSVQFGSDVAARSMAVQAIFAQRTDTDMVQVNARLVSCLNTQSIARVRTSFLRANMAPSEAVTPWKVVILEPKATAVYTEMSTNSAAAAYLIEIAVAQ